MKTQSLKPLITTIGCILFFVIIVSTQSCRKGDNFKAVRNSSFSVDEMRKDTRPNIILILADDVGYDAIAANGNESFETPVLDQMARTGMNFTHVYSSPLCSPSRTAFISGKYNFRNYFTWGSYNPNEKSIANLAQSAGYATYAAGKWQFDGGDVTAHILGFDDYCLWDPFKEKRGGSPYKDPQIYKNGNFVPLSETAGMYGDDLHTSNVLSFIQNHKNRPFFVYYAITLCHGPYSPTPDDPEFASWNPAEKQSDVKFFPSMIKYMDKKIGELIDSLKRWNLYDNTILMFSGDNGTPHDIFYWYQGQYVEGGKSQSNDRGTHVPLIVTWPSRIDAGSENRNLISFQDFLPTVAEAVGAEIDESYGIIDGLSFFGQLVHQDTESRSYVFNHYNPMTRKGNDRLKRWINDTTYKLYDNTGKFYNIFLDPEEKKPIKKNQQTPEEKAIIKNFQAIMDSLK